MIYNCSLQQFTFSYIYLLHLTKVVFKNNMFCYPLFSSKILRVLSLSHQNILSFFTYISSHISPSSSPLVFFNFLLSPLSLLSSHSDHEEDINIASECFLRIIRLARNVLERITKES